MRFGNDMITFEEAVAYLKDMPRFTVKKNPADSRDLKWFLKKLGNPEKDLRIIHVAGTNGKGSVCAYMSSILQAIARPYLLHLIWWICGSVLPSMVK